MLPLAALVALYLSADYGQTIKTAKDGVFSAAKLAAATESRIFDETRSLLGTLALGPIVTSEGGKACSDFIADVSKANPLYNTIGVVDAEGTINCHNSLRTRQGLTDVDLVKRMKAPGAQNFQVGNFVIGRVSGKPTVILAHSFPSADGGFTGAVFASLSLDRLTHEVERVSDGGSRSVMLVEPGTDRVLVHFPPLPGIPFGTAFPGNSLMAAMHSAQNNGTTEVRGIDGIDRVYGFAPLPSAGNIVLAVGEDRGTLIAPVRDRLILSILGFLTFLLAAASAVWWLSDRTQLRPMQRLMDMAGRIGLGKADVTTDLEPWQAPEFRNLGGVLELMAVRLSDGRKAEAIVAESEARFRLLAENTADMITCSDDGGRRVYVSPACRDLLGYEPVDLMGKQPRELAHPDDVSIVDNMMAEVMAARPASGVQY
ncbi:MAG: PAS domain S-box protein, partial [Zymomonas sp.]